MSILNDEFITKNFVDSEVAYILKNIGFVEDCFGRYYKDSFVATDCYNHNSSVDFASAPLIQQVIGWLEKEYNIHIDPELFDPITKEYAYFITRNGIEFASFQCENKSTALKEGIKKALIMFF